jgi:hypothetical protein
LSLIGALIIRLPIDTSLTQDGTNPLRIGLSTIALLNHDHRRLLSRDNVEPWDQDRMRLWGSLKLRTPPKVLVQTVTQLTFLLGRVGPSVLSSKD